MQKPIYAAIVLAGGMMITSCAEKPTGARAVDTMPEIWPDYAGVTVPKGIAPLDFGMTSDEAEAVYAVASNGRGGEIVGSGEEANFDIDEWHSLLADCADGDSIMVRVSAKFADGWKEYRPFAIYVSGDEMKDMGLAYRRIAPGYEVYSRMGLYERDLATFRETSIMENTEVTNSCINCHTSRRGHSEDYVFHIRGEKGGTVVSRNGHKKLVNMKRPETIGATTYPAWHPDGRYIAFSVNTTRQSFHQASAKRLEVFDVASDMVIYDADEDRIITSPMFNKTDSCWETFPCFSADGRTLYYCSATPLPVPAGVRDVHYILKRVGFDATTGQLAATADTVLDLSAQGLSISFPRTSADGRHLMFTTCDYGTFPIWHKESDLWMMDLKTGEARPMDEINSDDTESFHNWSSDSHWVVFSSRRGDGLYTRLYLAHIDADGHASKPFLLPQVSPKKFYREMMESYNAPEAIQLTVNS